MIDNVQRVTRPAKLPVVFTPAEMRAVLAHHKGDYRLMTELLYGAGLLQSVYHDTLPWLISVSLDLAVQMPSAVAKVLNRAATLVVEHQYERERTKFPESRVGAIRVHGPERFVSDIKEALAQLQRCYPYGYSLVQRYVRASSIRTFVDRTERRFKSCLYAPRKKAGCSFRLIVSRQI